MELGQLVLKRFLLLVLLLDRAVTGPKPCPKGAPLLFCRGQPTKSSSQVLLSWDLGFEKKLQTEFQTLNVYKGYAFPSIGMPSETFPRVKQLLLGKPVLQRNRNQQCMQQSAQHNGCEDVQVLLYTLGDTLGS